MIWFECKKCGKKHSKADNLGGSLVFCECGQGNRVPWSSTIPEPAEAPRPPASRNRGAAPVPDQQDDLPRRPRRSDPEDDEDDSPRPAPQGDYPLPRRSRPLRRVRPEFCFNHDEDASEATCEDCKVRFCSRCVVTVQGKTLCGACKNFRIAALNRPKYTQPLAILAFVLSLVSGPVVLLLTLMGIGGTKQDWPVGVSVALCLGSMILPGAGLVLAWLARKQIEHTPRTSGGALVSSSLAVCLIGVLWCAVVASMLLFKHIEG